MLVARNYPYKSLKYIPGLKACHRTVFPLRSKVRWLTLRGAEDIFRKTALAFRAYSLRYMP